MLRIQILHAMERFAVDASMKIFGGIMRHTMGAEKTARGREHAAFFSREQISGEQHRAQTERETERAPGKEIADECGWANDQTGEGWIGTPSCGRGGREETENESVVQHRPRDLDPQTGFWVRRRTETGRGNEGAEQATEEAGGVQLGGIPIGSRASGTEEHVPARISHHAEGAVRW